MVNFQLFAESHGLIIRDLREGKIQRVPTVTKPKSDNGAYFFERDRGWVMDWAVGDEPVWWHDPHAKPWTEAQKLHARRQAEAGARDRAKRAARAAQEAARMIGEAKAITPRAAAAWRPGRQAVEAVEAHPYLVAKGFPQETGLVHGDALLIPMFSAGEYRLVGLQRIGPDGEKKFLPGQRAKGAIHRFGDGRQRECWLAEGYATGLSLRAALKKLYRRSDVVVCFSASNLAHVASLGIGTHVAADNDESRAGEQAAIETGLPYAMPAKVGQDMNDVHRAEGLGVVCELVQRRI